VGEECNGGVDGGVLGLPRVLSGVRARELGCGVHIRACHANRRKAADGRAAVKLRFGSRERPTGDSPTLYTSDQDSYVIQGWKVHPTGDPNALNQPFWRNPWSAGN
jgi:hypothetical protein